MKETLNRLSAKQKLDLAYDLLSHPKKEKLPLLKEFLREPNRYLRFQAFDTLTLSYKEFLKRDDLYFLIYDDYMQLAANAIYFLSKELNIIDKNILNRSLETIRKVKDEIVLTDMIEVLYDYKKDLKKTDIKFLLSSKSKLVRRDTIVLLGHLKDVSIQEIIDFLKEQRSAQSKLGALEALVIKGEYRNLDEIIHLLLTTKDYQARSASINTLMEYVHQDNFSKILTAFYRAKRREKTKAVSSNLDESIKYLEKISK